MKKRMISLLLAAVMVLTLLPAVQLTVNADDAYAILNGSTYIYSMSALKSQINNKGGTFEIEMLRDWNLADSGFGDRITVGNDGWFSDTPATMTIHMNGHMLTRGLTSSSSYGNVFFVVEGSALTLIGSDNETEASVTHTVRDYASNTGGSITKTVTGGTLTGAYGSGDGGAIYFGGDEASVVLQNVTIAGNYFGDNGAGVRFNGESCSLTMDNSKILYNYCGNYGGGVVCENKDSCSLVMNNDSEISGNSANYGGGVYINNSSFTLKGDGTAKINGNTARTDGGGIYCNADNGNISGCILDGNSASASGGGIYFNDALVSINGNRVAGVSACTVTNNTAGTGGGIFVEDAFTLTLSGLMTIEDNHNTSNADSNLYLKTGALLDLQNDTRSVIHFGVQSPSNNLQLSAAAGTYAEFNYFYDGSGYHAKWYDDLASNDSKYRFLYLVTGDAETIPEPTAVGLEDKIPQTDYVVDNTAYSRFATYFTFSVITDAENDLDAICYYTDGYFFEDPAVYNEHLCTMSAALMAAGYYTNRGRVGTYGYETATENQYYNKHASLRQLLANIGCADETIYVNQFNLEQPGMDSIGFGMAHKPLKTADGTDTGYILVPISIRGSGYEAEWTSNVTIGAGGEHLGFAVAANTVYSEILGYIDSYGLTEAAQQGRLIFWVTGYSRSGATANLTAKRLIDHQSPALTFSPSTNTTLDATALAGVSDDGFGSNKVFCYTFEAAQGGTDAAQRFKDGRDENSDGVMDASAYFCIHNVVNKADAVPYVGPTEMGFKRYGVDHYMPGSAAGAVQTTTTNVTRGASGDTTVTTYRDNDYYAVGGTDYQKLRGVAKEHMAAVNPYMVFDDYFTTATLNWVGGNLPSWMPSWLGKKNLNTTVSSNVSVETYLEELMAHLQTWGIPGRTWFATEPVSINGTTYNTFQQALRDVFEALYSMPDGSGGLLNGLDMSGFSIPYSKIYDLYYNVIRGWYNQTDSKKEELLTWVWDEVISTSGLLDNFTDTQIDNLHQAWPTIADPLLTILSMDYNDETLVSGTGQIYLGTLLYNVNRILNNHFAETLFGWLRADDSYYTNKNGGLYNTTIETTRYAITAPASVATPTGRAVGTESSLTVSAPADGTVVECFGAQVLHLDVTGIGGEAIYYQLDSGAENQLYEQGISISGLGEHTFTAYAMSYGVRSAVGTYRIRITDAQEYTLDELEPTFVYSGGWVADNSADHSSGHAQKLTVSTAAPNLGPTGSTVTFTFTGEGYRIYTDPSCRAGTVYVNRTWEEGGQTKSFSQIFQLYRGYADYNSETGVWSTVANTDAGYSASLYHQIPAIWEEGLSRNTYTVTIQPIYIADFDVLHRGSADFLFDSVTFLNLNGHGDDYEYTNLRDAVVSADSLISLDVLYVNYSDGWLADGAAQKAYFYNSGNSSNAWADAFPTGTEHVWAVKKPAGDWTHVIFVRGSSSYTGSDYWSDGNNGGFKWNQSGNLEIGSYDYFLLKGNFDQEFSGTYETTENTVFIDVSNVTGAGNNWNEANHIAVYFFGAGETWVNALPSGETNIYKAEIPEGGYTGMIVCNMNASANNWDNKHEQTVDITIGDFNLVTLLGTKTGDNRNYSTGAYTDHSADIRGGVMLDGGCSIDSTNLSLLKENGPKNMLYLGSRQALIFTVGSTAATVTANECWVGAKAISAHTDAKLSAYIVNSDNSLTELFTHIFTDFSEAYVQLAGSSNLKGKTVMLYNAGTDPLALTRLRTQTAVTLSFTAPSGWRSLRLLRRMQAGTLAPVPVNGGDYFVGHSLSLDGDIGVNFYIDLGDIDPANATVTLSWEGGSVTIPLTAQELQSNGTYRVTARVAAKEMTRPVSASLRDGDTLRAVSTYSVAEYAMRILANEGGEFNNLFSDPQKLPQLQALCRVMLVYGAKAQILFDYQNDPETLADHGLTDPSLEALGSEEIANLTGNLSPNLSAFGLKYYGCSLLLETTTTFRLYFRVTDSALFERLVVQKDGTTLTGVITGSYVYYDLAELPAADVMEPITLSFGSDESGQFVEACTGSYNVGAYLRLSLNDNEPALRDVVTALYRYNQAAKLYFN